MNLPWVTSMNQFASLVAAMSIASTNAKEIESTSYTKRNVVQDVVSMAGDLEKLTRSVERDDVPVRPT